MSWGVYTLSFHLVSARELPSLSLATQLHVAAILLLGLWASAASLYSRVSSSMPVEGHVAMSEESVTNDPTGACLCTVPFLGSQTQDDAGKTKTTSTSWGFELGGSWVVASKGIIIIITAPKSKCFSCHTDENTCRPTPIYP